MSAARLQSKYSKRKVRLRKARARHSLLPPGVLEESRRSVGWGEEAPLAHVILPIETEKEMLNSDPFRWTEATYELNPTSQFLLSDKCKSQIIRSKFQKLKIL